MSLIKSTNRSAEQSCPTIIVACIVLSVLSGVWDGIFLSGAWAEALVQEGAKERVSQFEILRELDWDQVNIQELYFDGPGKFDYTVEFKAKGKIRIGRRDYPAGTSVVGKGFLFRVYGPVLGAIEGREICNQVGQDGRSLEIFEIGLCNDLKLPEGVVPAGSIIDFDGSVPKGKLSVKDISCMQSGGPTKIFGKPIIKGQIVSPNSTEWTHQDKHCFREAK